MMISKFNRLIRNKFIWAGFAILVSIAMVGLFSPSMGAADPRDRSPGKLYGKPISADAFQRARLFAFGFQGRVGDTPEERIALEEEVWQRLAMLRKAERMNITVSDAELAEAIQRNPAFQVNGRFDRRQYEHLVRAQMRVDLPQFEAYLREELIIQRLLGAIGQTLWIPPDEVGLTVRNFTDTFTVATIALPYEQVVGTVEITEDDARAYYEANPDRFREPAARRVRMVRWQAADFADSVEISPADIARYYDTHQQDFISEVLIVTNAVETIETVSQPLEAVSNVVHAVLARERAQFNAEREAMDFHEALQPGRYGGGTPFETVASTWGLPITTTDWFSAQAEVPGTTAGRDFSRTAFRLSKDDPAGYFSFPIRGDGTIYVIAYESEREAYTAEWDDVRDRAFELARRAAEDEAFETLLADTHVALTEARVADRDLDAAAAELGLVVTVHPPFSIYDSEPDVMPHFNRIVGRVMERQAGELADPVRTADGALIAAVLNREPGDAFAAGMLRTEVADMLYNSRMHAHIEAWARDLIARVRTRPGDNLEP